MVAAGSDFWVCGGCRSVNNLRAKQCYNCRTPRERAAVDPTSIDPSTTGGLREIELPAYESPKLYGTIASALILAVAGMQVIATILGTMLVLRVLDGAEPTDGDLVGLGLVNLLTLGVGVAALVAWSAWLSKTVTAMPALGLGYPPGNGLTAFVESFLPGLNLLRVPAIVRDIVRRLSPEEGRGDALIFVAWIGLFGGFVVPRVGRWLGFFAADTIEGTVRNELVVEAIAIVLVLVGAIFLVVLISWIQGRIDERRAAQVAGEPAAGSVATVAVAPPTVAAAAVDPVAPVAATSPARAAVAPPIQRPLTAVAPRVEDPTLAMPATPIPTPPPATQGPRLTLRIAGGSVTGAVDDAPEEPIDLDELRSAAPALARTGGSAVVIAGPDDTDLAGRIVDLLRSNGIVPETRSR